MVSDSKKLLVAFCSLLFFSSCFHGPKDWYNDAMKKGLRGDFYRIENPKQKDIDIYECFKYAEKNNYVVVNYTSQRVNKYGGVSETLYTLDFLPWNEYMEMVYSKIQVPGKIPFSKLKQQGTAYFFLGVNNTHGEITNRNKFYKEVDYCNIINNCCNNYGKFDTSYGTPIKERFFRSHNILWSGNLKNGFVDGTGIAFGLFHKGGYNRFSDRDDPYIWVYLKGTFEDGFPVGQCTVYWYEGQKEICCDDYKLTSKSFSLSRFKNDTAFFEGDGLLGYINRDGVGNQTEESFKENAMHTIVWTEDNRTKAYRFDTPVTENDKKNVSDILRTKTISENKSSKNRNKLLYVNNLSIPHFYLEEYSKANRKWSKERLSEILKDLQGYYDVAESSKELKTILLQECRQYGMQYEYVLCTSDMSPFTEKERKSFQDRIFYNYPLETIVKRYYSCFTDGKYKGEDLKTMLHNITILSDPSSNPIEWVQAYIENAHQMLKRNDSLLFAEWNFKNDLYKYPLLTESDGLYTKARGLMSLFSNGSYIFKAEENIKWYPILFEKYKKENVKKIDEAIKYRTLMDGIALANQINNNILNRIRDDEDYYTAMNRNDYTTGWGTHHRQRMTSAIDVAREFAASKPEIASACRKAEEYIVSKMEAIDRCVMGKNDYWTSVWSNRAKRMRERDCENCKIDGSATTFPSGWKEGYSFLFFGNPSQSEKAGKIRLKNYKEFEWRYVEEYGKVVIKVTGAYSGTYNSVDEMMGDIIEKCQKEYCD